MDIRENLAQIAEEMRKELDGTDALQALEALREELTREMAAPPVSGPVPPSLNASPTFASPVAPLDGLSVSSLTSFVPALSGSVSPLKEASSSGWDSPPSGVWASSDVCASLPGFSAGAPLQAASTNSMDSASKIQNSFFFIF